MIPFCMTIYSAFITFVSTKWQESICSKSGNKTTCTKKQMSPITSDSAIDIQFFFSKTIEWFSKYNPPILCSKSNENCKYFCAMLNFYFVFGIMESSYGIDSTATFRIQVFIVVVAVLCSLVCVWIISFHGSMVSKCNEKQNIFTISVCVIFWRIAFLFESNASQHIHPASISVIEKADC